MVSTESRSRTLGLLAAITTLAILIVALGFEAAANVQNSSVKSAAAEAVPGSGILLVRATLNQSSLNLANFPVVPPPGGNSSVTQPGQGLIFYNSTTGAASAPLSDVNVTVAHIGGAPTIPLLVKTDLNGEAEIPLGAGSYRVSLVDSIFQQTVVVRVASGNVTEVDAVVTARFYPVLFSEFPAATSSGVVAPWDHAYALVDVSGSNYTTRTPTFIQYDVFASKLVVPPNLSTNATFQGFLTYFPVQLRQAISVTSAERGPNPGELWLAFQPKEFFDASKLSLMTLATYSVAYKVNIHGP